MQRDEIVKAFAGVKMKRLLLPLLAPLALPKAVNAEADMKSPEIFNKSR